MPGYAAPVYLPYLREIPRHLPSREEPTAGPRAIRRRRLRLIPPIAATAALLVALPLDTACFCDPGPSRPTMESCTDPTTDFSGVTGMTLTGARYVNGIQGGSHFQFEIEATGTAVPTCFAYEGTLTGLSGTSTALSGAIRAEADGAGVTTSRTIYLFEPPFETATSFVLEVTALGRTATVSSGGDAGTGGDAGP